MTKQDVEFTPVVFRRSRRKEPEGLAAEIVAVMPCEPADYEGRHMTCYAHLGQHGACSWEWYNATRAAKPAEYADLLKELESIGYRVKVYKRIQPWIRDELRKRLDSK